MYAKLELRYSSSPKNKFVSFAAFELIVIDKTVNIVIINIAIFENIFLKYLSFKF